LADKEFASMKIRNVLQAAPLLVAGVAFAFSATSANALTAQECSAKYKAAKSAGTLAGKTWNQFRKDECGDASAAAPAAAASGAVFPKAISPKFAKETPSKARLHTCAEQYKANKASNGNGGMKWIMKGGGYWSACNKALKGA
jgi:hypothetical protein